MVVSRFECLGQKVNFGGKIKRWLEIILGAILDDSGYFWVLMKEGKKCPSERQCKIKIYSRESEL